MSAGTLDTSFGDNGKLITYFNNSSEYNSIQSLFIQHDDSIIVGGYYNDNISNNYYNSIMKYSSNGTLDSTFNTNITPGKLITDTYSNADANNGTKNMILQQDNKIVILGRGWGTFSLSNTYVLTRYNIDGTSDGTFGIDSPGMVSTGLSSNYSTYLITPDFLDNIIIYVVSDASGYLMKFDKDGNKINSFGSNGIQETIFNNNKYCWSINIKSNNNIILGGRSSGGLGVVPNPYIFCEYDTSGNINTLIGDSGVVSYNGIATGNTGYESIISLPDKYLFFGDSDANTLITKYNTDATLDLSSNIIGYTSSSILQSDGKIVVAGYIYDINTDIDNFIVSRINVYGELDNTFGQNGSTITSFPDQYYKNHITAIGIQSNGNIVVGGYSYSSDDTYEYSYFSLARYIGISTSNICFLKNTPITTDQGIIPIDKINPYINTINNKKIISVTQTKSCEKQIICINKDAFGIDHPNIDIYITTQHKILYNNKMIPVCELIGKNKYITFIDYNGDTVYNILMENYDVINVANLIFETLDPVSDIAKSYNNQLYSDNYNKLIQNKIFMQNNKKKYLLK